MSVAAVTTPETKTRPVSLWFEGIKLGVFLLAALGVVFYGVPYLWHIGVAGWLRPSVGSFVDVALLIVADLAAAVILVLAGIQLVGHHPPHGIRSATFLAIASIVAVALLLSGLLALLEQSQKSFQFAQGLGLAVLMVLCWLFWKFISTDRMPRWSLRLEEAGWLEPKFYKRSQGVRVRRLTILGLLLLCGSGIYTMVHNHVIGAHDWAVTLPFVHNMQPVTLVRYLDVTIPVLLAGLSIWFSWRVVNFPVFADFLIATEAEINKVSWPTRLRLIQDTIVVLITVVLITAFLFLIDIFWSFLLSRSFIGVLPNDEEKGKNESKQLNTTEW